MSDNLPELSRSFTEEAIMWDSHSLPPEILLDIIIRLPIKSIITCTSVCKTWKSLIQNPSFISDHLRHSATKYLLFSLYSKTAWQVYRIPHEQGKEHYALHWDDNKDFNEYTKFYFPLLHGQERFRVVGTCDGLICLANYICCDTFIIWNPCIRKFVQLKKPLPLPNIPPFRYSVSVGFGIDSKTSDYKVARILSFRDRKSASPAKLEVEVYSLATAEWKTLTTTALPPTGTECYGNPHASVNGALHWVASRRTKDNMLIKFVMVLDLEDEIFSEMAMPKFAENERNLPSTISAYGNSLACIKRFL
ncbi:F-box/kelch-repeat protein At3g23880 [Quercus suber]|uniref:F-box/kelch-repeat protein At3g23880 n=1 Tax=Quercus suber TaxID=58331 RepID=UPI000CE23C77|nr:F-box/kelch-repeat protein At3g23880-like [Quercus suber]